VRHEVIASVAEKMHVRRSTLQRLMEGKAGMLERWGADESSLALYKAEEILGLAAKGNVLIRGSAYSIFEDAARALGRGPSFARRRPALGVRRWRLRPRSEDGS
jgi:hypothetical protein